jgi:hypothetical protein
MTMPQDPKKGRGFGGYRRPTQRVGEFIVERMAGGKANWASNLYKEYADYVKSVPFTESNKKGAKRKPMSYGTFRSYLYVARKLGLIEYVNIDGTIPKANNLVVGEDSIKPYLQKRLYFQVVAGQEGSPAWQDLYGFYKGSL